MRLARLFLNRAKQFGRKQGMFHQCLTDGERQSVHEAHFVVRWDTKVEQSGRVRLEKVGRRLDGSTFEMLLQERSDSLTVAPFMSGLHADAKQQQYSKKQQVDGAGELEGLHDERSPGDGG